MISSGPSVSFGHAARLSSLRNAAGVCPFLTLSFSSIGGRRHLSAFLSDSCLFVISWTHSACGLHALTEVEFYGSLLVIHDKLRGVISKKQQGAWALALQTPGLTI